MRKLGRGTLLMAVFTLLMAVTVGAYAEVFEGVGQGNNGPIRVQVTLESGVITQVEVAEHAETPGICDTAIAQIPAGVVAVNGVDVDTISGATNTSKGILEAVENALISAGVAEEKVEEYLPAPTHEDLNQQAVIDQWREDWVARKIENDEKYAPKVKTLENGVKIQKVNADHMYWNTAMLNAEERGCNSCHDLKQAVRNLPKTHNALRTIGTMEMNYATCLACHTLDFPYAVLKESMHGIHLNSDSFGGNCLSCHHIDDNGDYVMWDYVKYDVLMDLNKVADVQGEFTYDENHIIDPEIGFSMNPDNSEPIAAIPRFAPDNEEVFKNWEIIVEGAVANPYTFKLTDVDEEDYVSNIQTVRCMIDNNGGMIGNYEFSGISVQDVLDKAQPLEGANLLNIHMDEYFYFYFPLEYYKENPDAMFAVKVNGEPVPAEMGYPTVMLHPGWYASQQVRYVIRLEVVQVPDDQVTSFYEGHEFGHSYMIDAGIPNNPTVGIFNVYDGQIFEYGEPIIFEGYADAFADKVTSVQFSLDNGETWTTYEVNDTEDDQWVYFTYEPKDLPMGSYVLTVRATCESGMENYLNYQQMFHVQ